MTQNQNIWQPVPAFVLAGTKFTDRVIKIDQLAMVRNGTTKGVTADKRAARAAMVGKALEVAGAVRAYGSDIGRSEWQAKVDYSPSDLRQVRDTVIVTLCQGIHDTANTHRAALADYSVDANTLADLQARINECNATVAKPRSVRSKRSAARSSIEVEFREADKVLDEKLDGLMAKYRSSQPVFYSAYTTAREIVDNGTGHNRNGNGNGNGSNGGGNPPPP